ncbi:MAG: M20 family metallo-hydrolase [Pseudomonadota bacterium]
MQTVIVEETEVETLLMTLGEIGRVGDTGVSRLAYSPEWVAAMEVCRRYAEDAGLAIRQDAVGNLWARLPGHTDAPALVTGSHIDSQDPGGRYDGALGAVGGLIALKAIKQQMGTPKRSLEAVVLCEEEGSRFPTTGFWGSRAIVGKITPDDLATTVSFDGVPIGEAMAAIGLDPAAVTDARRTDIGGFVELHIEQGPILEAEDLPVGLVTAINGMGQFEVVLEGQDNHAGACPMDLRCDPMAGFAEIASSLIDHAHRAGRPTVTTIGQVAAEPAGIAIVPRRVRFSIDARHPDPETRRALYATQDRMMTEICQRRGLRYERKALINLEPCQSDPDILQKMKTAAAQLGLAHRMMISGAGHDAQQMSLIAPVAMIFVRSAGGRSHTPEEFSTLADCTDGIRLLAQTLCLMSFG